MPPGCNLHFYEILTASLGKKSIAELCAFLLFGDNIDARTIHYRNAVLHFFCVVQVLRLVQKASFTAEILEIPLVCCSLRL